MGPRDTDWRPDVGFETPRDHLLQRLGFLMKREGWLSEKGITCAVKDNPETSCHACPFSKAETPAHDRCTLCRIGHSQETIQTLLIAQTCAAAAKKAPAAVGV